MPGGNKNKKRKASEGNETLSELKHQIAILEGGLHSLQVAHDETIKTVKFLREENEALRDELKCQVKKVDICYKRANDLEQYQRRSHIRIFGLDDRNPHESANETEQIVARLIREQLGVPINSWEVEIAHRTGRFSSDSNRPVIVRFLTRKTKSRVLAKMKNLKGSHIFLAEDLTQENLRRLKKLRDLKCVQQVWTRDGRLFAKNSSNLIKEVKWEDAIDEQLFIRASGALALHITPADTDGSRHVRVVNDQSPVGTTVSSTENVNNATNSQPGNASVSTGNASRESSQHRADQSSSQYQTKSPRDDIKEKAANENKQQTSKSPHQTEPKISDNSHSSEINMDLVASSTPKSLVQRTLIEMANNNMKE